MKTRELNQDLSTIFNVIHNLLYINLIKNIIIELNSEIDDKRKSLLFSLFSNADLLCRIYINRLRKKLVLELRESREKYFLNKKLTAIYTKVKGNKFLRRVFILSLVISIFSVGNFWATNYIKNGRWEILKKFAILYLNVKRYLVGLIIKKAFGDDKDDVVITPEDVWVFKSVTDQMVVEEKIRKALRKKSIFEKIKGYGRNFFKSKADRYVICTLAFYGYLRYGDKILSMINYASKYLYDVYDPNSPIRHIMKVDYSIRARYSIVNTERLVTTFKKINHLLPIIVKPVLLTYFHPSDIEITSFKDFLHYKVSQFVLDAFIKSQVPVVETIQLLKKPELVFTGDILLGLAYLSKQNKFK